MSSLAGLLATCKSEVKYWLNYERRHKHVEEFLGLIHLVTLSHNSMENFKYLFCDEVICMMLFKRVNAVLDYFVSQVTIVFREVQCGYASSANTD